VRVIRDSMPSFNESCNVLSSNEMISEEHADIVSMIREKKDVIPRHGITVNIYTDYKNHNNEKFYKVVFRKGTSLGTSIVKDLTIFDESLPVENNIIRAQVQKKFFELYAQYHYDFGEKFLVSRNPYNVIIEPDVAHARCFECYSWATRNLNKELLESRMMLNMVLLGDITRYCDCKTFYNMSV